MRGLSSQTVRSASLPASSDTATIAGTSFEDPAVQLPSWTQRLIRAREQERERISRDLHDDLGSRIALLAFAVERIAAGDFSTEDMRRELAAVMERIGDLAQTVRGMAHELHPPLLANVGIGNALQSLCREFERHRNLQVDVQVLAAAPQPEAETGLCIFRIVQECLQNIARHSGASKARIVLDHAQGMIRLKVSDEGKGFVEAEAHCKGGLGLISIGERLRGLGGSLEVRTGPGQGTEIVAVIPQRSQAA